MAPPKTTPEQIQAAVDAMTANGNNQVKAALALGLSRGALQARLLKAAASGFDPAPIMAGFEISRASMQLGEDEKVTRQFITMKPELGPEYEVAAGQIVKGVSTLVDRDGRTIQQWIKTREDAEQTAAAMRAVVDALKEDLPRAEPVQPPKAHNDNLLNQYTVTDLHFGMLAWGEETGADYDLKIAEQLLLDWFAAAIRQSPDASTAILAQLGDLLHHDSKASVTPAHHHVLDADSRLQKMIRVAIRTIRRVIGMLLEKHERVHVIMADANHDEAGGAWLRELFATFYEDEPRVTVDTSPNTYYVYEFGKTSLFYHHGHKRKIGDVDSVFAGKFRGVYGRTEYSYAHIGHLHSDELKSTNIMKVERHETLAAPDAYAANGGWLSKRSAKVITYSKQHGEVGRITLTPDMVRGAA